MIHGKYTNYIVNHSSVYHIDLRVRCNWVIKRLMGVTDETVRMEYHCIYSSAYVKKNCLCNIYCYYKFLVTVAFALLHYLCKTTRLHVLYITTIVVVLATFPSQILNVPRRYPWCTDIVLKYSEFVIDLLCILSFLLAALHKTNIRPWPDQHRLRWRILACSVINYSRFNHLIWQL